MTHTLPQMAQKFIVWAAVLAVFACFFSNPDRVRAEDERGRRSAQAGGDKYERIKSLIEKAREAQKRRAWEEAEKLWDKVLGEIKNLEAPLKAKGSEVEARENRSIAKEMKEPGVSTAEPQEPEQRPDSVGAKNLLKYYPKGRKTQNVALLTITGKGVFEDWGFRTDRNILYVYQFRFATEVLENSGNKLKFALNCQEVSQVAFHAEQSLELALPDEPLVKLLWGAIEVELLQGIPVYYMAKKVVTAIDPRMKKTLSFLQGAAQLAGVKLNDTDEVEMVARIEALSGMKVELEYTDGIGVTTARTVGGQKVQKDMLLGLAENSGLLLDYFIFPGAEKKVGDEWKVRAREVGSLLPIGNDASLLGAITLRRGKDLEPGKRARLYVVKGELDVRGRGKYLGEEGKVNIKKGIVLYSLGDLFAESSKLELDAHALYVSKDHLLFRARKLRDLEVKAVYSAKIVGK